jgi:hypothetical protein
MAKTPNTRNQDIQDLRSLLRTDPGEEEVHQFLKTHRKLLERPITGHPRHFIQSVFSKFHVTPDCIPDFTSLVLNRQYSQSPNRLTFIELKKPSAKLYTNDGRKVSPDLNDALGECHKTERLLEMNRKDYFRRMRNWLEENESQQIRQVFPSCTNGFPELAAGLMENAQCNSIIVIGRRNSLSSEDIDRTQTLSGYGKWPLRVITYDSVLEALEDGHDPFWPGRA